MSWEVEKAVWWRALKGVLRVQPPECGLLMTEPLFNLPSIQCATMQARMACACRPRSLPMLPLCLLAQSVRAAALAAAGIQTQSGCPQMSYVLLAVTVRLMIPARHWGPQVELQCK